jgi:hypothetical protein
MQMLPQVTFYRCAPVLPDRLRANADGTQPYEQLQTQLYLLLVQVVPV